MLFNSAQFLIFFPVVVLFYFIIPSKFKNIWLLFASYYFYMCWNARYIVLIAFCTVVTYLCSFFISRYEAKHIKTFFLIICLLCNLSILFIFKYLNFALLTLNRSLSIFSIQLNLPVFDILLPVGISFYTFQALSYTIDVYRGTIKAEKNFLTYALFVSFFPQLVAGPIERSKNLLSQLNETRSFDYDRIKSGILLMCLGYFQKMIIASRAAALVDTVYNNYETYSGLPLLLAILLFSVQIYCDFGGYSMIAIGAAEVLGIKLMENFHQPYFAESIQDFWRRWHISLSTWFRDYVYIPLGGNRCKRSRKYFNLLVTFLISGLWHGASMHFVIWGGLNGFFQILENFLEKWRRKMPFKRFFTFILVCFVWVFFRAESFHKAIFIIRQSLFSISASQFLDGSLLHPGLSKCDFILLLISIIFLFFIDLIHEKGILFHQKLAAQPIYIRYFTYIFIILVFLFQIIHDYGQPASSFIYFQF